MTIHIYLLARPSFEGSCRKVLEELLPEGEGEWREEVNATAAERLVEFAGRVCYLSFGTHQAPSSNADYIRKLIRNGHESVLEHAAWTVLISGVSRAFTHQLVRHRVGTAFSQLSQQYHDESNVRFVKPPELDQTPDLTEIWENAMRDSQAAYRKIISDLSTRITSKNRIISRETTRAVRSAARSVLPNATETAIVITINARALRHLLKVRGGIIGDAEMRCASAALLETLRPEGPAFFYDFAIEYPADGLPLVIHQPDA